MLRNPLVHLSSKLCPSSSISLQCFSLGMIPLLFQSRHIQVWDIPAFWCAPGFSPGLIHVVFVSQGGGTWLLKMIQRCRWWVCTSYCNSGAVNPSFRHMILAIHRESHIPKISRGRDKTASSSSRGGLDWILWKIGENFFTEKVVKHKDLRQGRALTIHPWKCSKNYGWALEERVNSDHGGAAVGWTWWSQRCFLTLTISWFWDPARHPHSRGLVYCSWAECLGIGVFCPPSVLRGKKGWGKGNAWEQCLGR